MSRETAMTQLLTINSSFVFIRGRLHLGSNSRQTTFPSLPSFSIISSCLQSIPTGHVECGRFFYKCKKSCYATVENGLYWQASSKCHSISLHTDLIVSPLLICSNNKVCARATISLFPVSRSGILVKIFQISTCK